MIRNWETSAGRWSEPNNIQSVRLPDVAAQANNAPAAINPNPVASENIIIFEALLPTVEALLSPQASEVKIMIPGQQPTEMLPEIVQTLPAVTIPVFPINNVLAQDESPELPALTAEFGHTAPSLLVYYDLQQQPFDVTPDPAFLYLSQMHREALSSIEMGVENLRGFIALVAEPGMGKTTLLNRLMEELRDSARVVFLFQTQCGPSELLRYLLNELEVEYDGTDVVEMQRVLSRALFEEMLQGRRFVLIVDEAQNLSESVLETIRLLSDYETTHSKLIQIVLAGQPQMVETLMRPGLAQLRQRIAVLASLVPLTVAETSAYIEHRLNAAGWHGRPLFTPDAIWMIAEASGGTPRSINNICFNAMLAGYLQRKEIIDFETVKKVVSKLDLEPLIRRPQPKVPDAAAPAPVELSGTAQLARDLAVALNAELPATANASSASKPEAMPGVTVTGTLNEKVRSQSWNKKHEFRIQVSFARNPGSGITVAERYYCCNFYVSEEQASNLRTGQPIRIQFEQD